MGEAKRRGSREERVAAAAARREAELAQAAARRKEERRDIVRMERPVASPGGGLTPRNHRQVLLTAAALMAAGLPEIGLPRRLG
jgi:hypothetical protein